MYMCVCLCVYVIYHIYSTYNRHADGVSISISIITIDS